MNKHRIHIKGPIVKWLNARANQEAKDQLVNSLRDAAREQRPESAWPLSYELEFTIGYSTHDISIDWSNRNQGEFTLTVKPLEDFRIPNSDAIPGSADGHGWTELFIDALTEVAEGIERSEIIKKLQNEHPERPVAWAERRHSL